MFTTVLSGSVRAPVERAMAIGVDQLIEAIEARGGIAIDLTERFGRPAVYVALPHVVERSDTEAERDARRRSAATRKHRRAVARTDPRVSHVGGPETPGALARYPAVRRAWPGTARGPRGMEPRTYRLWLFANDPARRRLVEWRA